jgi:hypothetical protein
MMLSIEVEALSRIASKYGAILTVPRVPASTSLLNAASAAPSGPESGASSLSRNTVCACTMATPVATARKAQRV